MKITKDDYDELLLEFQRVMLRNNIPRYVDNLRADPRVQDINKRLRWDMFWAIPKEVRDPLMDRIYTYANDTHLDTALKRASKESGVWA
jgi:protoheme ferro-lyase